MTEGKSINMCLVSNPPKRVYLGVPIGACGSMAAETAQAIMYLSRSKHEVVIDKCGSSALVANFNQLLVNARNLAKTDSKGFDYFAMIHTDIIPTSESWLDDMIKIAIESDADVLSVTAAIKDSRGLTSVAIDTDRWTPRRLTLAEIHAAPKTFTGQYAAHKWGAGLLINTGCMLIRMDREWSNEFCFDTSNEIVKTSSGGYEVRFEPEDWKFSRWAGGRGLNVVSTREVELYHLGLTRYANSNVWGTQKIDEGNIVQAALTESGLR